jgi:hypothetical protein
MTFSVSDENERATDIDFECLMPPDAKPHRPIRSRDRLAYLLRWAMQQWQEDHTQPRDLDGLLEDAARALDNSVSVWWGVAAWAEACILAAIIAHRWHG